MLQVNVDSLRHGLHYMPTYSGVCISTSKNRHRQDQRRSFLQSMKYLEKDELRENTIFRTESWYLRIFSDATKQLTQMFRTHIRSTYFEQYFHQFLLKIVNTYRKYKLPWATLLEFSSRNGQNWIKLRFVENLTKYQIGKEPTSFSRKIYKFYRIFSKLISNI